MNNDQIEPFHWLKILFDISSTLILILFFALIKLIGKPFKSSFSCNDYSINMPYKNSTVTNTHLILISLITPLLTIILSEVICNFINKKKNPINKKIIYKYKIKLFRAKIIQIPEQLANFYIKCGSFFFGLAATAVLTDFIKILVGRLRPNFLDVCKPNLKPYTQLCGFKNVTFLTPDVDFKCMSADLTDVDESKLSFPSGHSSLSFYSMIFLILYLNSFWKCKRFGLLTRLIQFLLLSLAIFTGLSRIIDNKHHPSDVFAGACLGTSFSLFSFYKLKMFVSNIKTKQNVSKRSHFDEENSTNFIGSFRINQAYEIKSKDRITAI